MLWDTVGLTTTSIFCQANGTKADVPQVDRERLEPNLVTIWYRLIHVFLMVFTGDDFLVESWCLTNTNAWVFLTSTVVPCAQRNKENFESYLYFITLVYRLAFLSIFFLLFLSIIQSINHLLVSFPSRLFSTLALSCQLTSIFNTGTSILVGTILLTNQQFLPRYSSYYNVKSTLLFQLACTMARPTQRETPSKRANLVCRAPVDEVRLIAISVSAQMFRKLHHLVAWLFTRPTTAVLNFCVVRFFHSNFKPSKPVKTNEIGLTLT